MRLLIIGDLEGYFSAASTIALKNNIMVKQAFSIEMALEIMRSNNSADLIMIDVNEDISFLNRALTSERISVPIVACGIRHDPTKAAAAIKAGAKEYLPLPPNEELIAAVLEAISNDNRSLIYKSDKMRNVIEIANQVAASNATILITGKSGAGKEVMSRYIHKHSKRSSKPLISVNCAAIPDNLLESELFGHEKGAFTGAIARRIGKFEESDNGTLLLDEISEIDIKLQAKLLRAIQEQEVDRIGGTKPIKLNLRIIATSNRDLRREVEEGRFREDLYFRLNIININLPSLSERKEDIEYFADYFIKKYSIANNIEEKKLSDEAKEIMMQHDWPGNVRELENTLYRAVLLAKGNVIEKKDLMLELKTNFAPKTLASMEHDLIQNTLSHCFGDQISAANILGISLKSLKEKLDQYEKI